jgi:hypothetical protein
MIDKKANVYFKIEKKCSRLYENLALIFKVHKEISSI